jgi:hypothetical protein
MSYFVDVFAVEPCDHPEKFKILNLLFYDFFNFLIYNTIQNINVFIIINQSIYL